MERQRVGPNRFLYFGIGAVAQGTGRVFQDLDVADNLGSWGRSKSKLLKGRPAFFSDFIWLTRDRGSSPSRSHLLRYVPAEHERYPPS